MSLSQFGTIPIDLRLDTWQYALRASYRRRLSPHATLSVGIDFAGQSTTVERNGSVNQPPREGDIVVFGQPPGSDTNFDRWHVNLATVAPYAVVEAVLGRLTLTPGVRFEPTMVDGDRMLPTVPGTVPIGYSRLALPANPIGFAPLRWAPNPRAGRGAARDQAADVHRGRRHLRAAARSRGPEPGLRQPAPSACRARCTRAPASPTS